MPKWGIGVLVFASMFVARAASAQPALISADGEEDDASLTLTMMDELITSDPNVWCSIDVLVGTAMVGLTAGDTVDVFLIEDDAFFNDTVWEDQHVITDEEVEAGAYEETFNCGAMGTRDGIGQLEFFAQIDVTKSLCGLTCFNDNPSTSNLDVDGLTDDDQEEDDAMGQAPEAELGMLGERVGADDDFVRVLLQDPGSIDAEIDFMAACGEIAVEIWDEDGNVIAENDPGDDSASASATDLEPGAYFVMTAPVDGNDLNFYDITVNAATMPDPTGTGGETDGDSDSMGDTESDSDSDSDSDPSASASASDPSASASDSNADASASGPDSGGTDGDGETETDGVDGDTGNAADAEGCGCRHTGRGAPPTWLALGLLGLLARRRRAYSVSSRIG